MKVLVIDDCLVDLRNLSQGLREAGHDVLEAPTFAEAAHAAREAASPFDAIVVDVVMPDSVSPAEAIDFMREIRAAKIITVSGNPNVKCDLPKDKAVILARLETVGKNPVEQLRKLANELRDWGA